MGQGTPGCLEAMGVRVIRVDAPADIAPAVKAASRLAFDGQQMVAVLISQKTLGFKDFRELAR
jgi:sulfopyruvate decarboxylase TPP-binding subunit